MGGIESDLDEMKVRQDAKLSDLDALNDVYCELAREYRLDSSDDLKNKFIQVWITEIERLETGIPKCYLLLQANNDWEDLSHELEATLKRIRHSRQLYDNFR